MTDTETLLVATRGTFIPNKSLPHDQRAILDLAPCCGFRIGQACMIALRGKDRKRSTLTATASGLKSTQLARTATVRYDRAGWEAMGCNHATGHFLRFVFN